MVSSGCLQDRSSWRLRSTFDVQCAKMQRVSEALQFAVVIEWSRSLSLKPQLLQELDFVLSRLAAEGSILEEFLQPRFFLESWLRFLFNKLEFLRMPWRHSAA